MRAFIAHLRRRGLVGFTVMAVTLSATAQQAAAYWSADWIEQTIISESLKTTYVRPSLALAVAETESNFRPHVVSHAGAVGIMQIMPATAFGLYKTGRAALFDPRTNIRIGVRFLDHLIKKYNGRIDLALSHYNGGSAVMKNGSARVLPYTRDYVSRVLARSRHYQNAVDKKVMGDARRRVGQRLLTVQTLAKHAKPDQKAALTTHINHVDKWLSVVNELAPRGR
ncbi:MAG: lytic transglycosylase domain-containing protein [Candidatus Puniceispirillum sp.]|nr:lytic transglycosylase domain-containing protein [Candidatus Puniceispirillum sp.]